MVVSSYGFNIATLVAAKITATEEETTLVVLSWAFFAGSVLAAVLGLICVRSTFDEPLRATGLHSIPADGARSVCAQAGVP